ncbi:hypothetical protein HN51_071627 [Arachis hypogaea]|uniref:RING-type E3 ubiquitin transferase n=1 Tax=Arachis hypogaea TaxID=3818 RepID=A0A444YXR3_ARAHY|nr:E3 ubiquitin-protein ligase ATL31 [Arachis ipaensis]XP_025656810.1 E3 ubiquitin-protein ligase ATL31 [Arachis hypogaea]QHO14238.1 E3 ubiquitin-protein ligase [Arachis hypogaea]RYR06723.1 hypothetical protein Ahy_B05g074021 [Arachis hypogaea]
MNFLRYCHVITTIFLLSVPNITAQLAAPSAHPPVVTQNNDGNPSIAIILVVLIFAFFMTGFCAVYIRHCNESYVLQGAAAANAATAPRGVDPEVLSTFPIMVYSTVKHLKTGHSASLQCAVCLSEFKDMDKLRLLPKCSHVFHPECIDAWLASHVTCPVCRAKMKSENMEFEVEIQELEGSANHMFDEMSGRMGEVSCDGNEGGDGEGVDGVVGKCNGTSKVRAFGLLVRSHSTGHSLVEPGKSLERFTLRLPEELRKQILEANHKCSGGCGGMKRSASYDVVLQSEVGEGSSSNKGSKNSRWVLSMTPPFVSRGWGHFSTSSGLAPPNECSTCSGIPRLWGSSAAREEKGCEGREGLQLV